MFLFSNSQAASSGISLQLNSAPARDDVLYNAISPHLLPFIPDAVNRALFISIPSLSPPLGLFSSPPATGKYNLKITFYAPSIYVATPPTFTFINPPTAPADATDFKNILASIAAKNKATQSQSPSAVPSGAVTPKPLSTASAAPSPLSVASSAKGKERAIPDAVVNAVASSSNPVTSSTGEASPTPALGGTSAVARGPPEKNVLTDWDLHKRVLVKNPQLASLHYELVQAGQLSDAEFWEGREVCIYAFVRCEL